MLTNWGYVNVTDRNSRRLETREMVSETDREALVIQGEIYRSANARYGQENIYCFTHWAKGGPCGHIPDSPAEKSIPPHKPFASDSKQLSR